MKAQRSLSELLELVEGDVKVDPPQLLELLRLKLERAIVQHRHDLESATVPRKKKSAK